MKPYWRSGVIAPCILDLGTRWWWMMNTVAKRIPYPFRESKPGREDSSLVTILTELSPLAQNFHEILLGLSNQGK
jgi:hypothetical protein